MVLGPLKLWLVNANGGLTELTVLRLCRVFVLVRNLHGLKGISYQTMCRGVAGIVLYVAPSVFDKISMILRQLKE